ncbi:hypothetical protein CVT25_002752 [Psilocybe cyanescens]|uniref:Uncharacterized protein n=1 Tax=Psilocybe cyanescens TaxID=93625 RepID=A0A409XUL8_PSICY|nr:hypothetical protein CVT25_002752 [Psilocybe cyanescens]
MGGFEKLLSQLEAGADGAWDDSEDEDDDEEDDDGDDGWGFGWGSGSGSGSGKQARTRNGAYSSNHKAGNSTHGHHHHIGGIWTGEIPEEAESKYLTMSWWLLHVGWKDVGERVRRGVEEVFDGVSLKTKLTAGDLHRLIADVRRRVECEITFEGNEKRTNFLSSLLPPTPETIHHVLLQGGFTSASAPLSSHNQHQHEGFDDPLGKHIDVDLDFETGSGYHVGSSAQMQQQHERKLSDASASLESSQLSHTFINSPAVALSAYPSPPNALQPSALRPPYQQQQQQTTATAHPITSQPQPTYIPPPPPPSAVYAQLLDAPFLALVEETRGVLAGADFARVLEGCLDRAVAVLFEGLEGNVFARAAVEEGAGADEGERVRLAGLLPGLARWSQLAMEGLPNELVDVFILNYKLRDENRGRGAKIVRPAAKRLSKELTPCEEAAPVFGGGLVALEGDVEVEDVEVDELVCEAELIDEVSVTP